MRLESCLAAGLAALFILCSTAPVDAGKNDGHCPPGLAKTSPECVPPGQTKKRYKEGERLSHSDAYRVIRDHRRFGLRAPPRGGIYVELDGELLLVAGATLRIIDAIGELDELLRY